MNKSQFTDFITEPNSLMEASIESLEELVTEFPYCASIQVLLCLRFFLENHIRFEDQLHKTAAIVNDRKMLKYHIDYLSNNIQKIELPDEYEAPVQEEIINKQLQAEEMIKNQKIEELKARIEAKLAAIEKAKKQKKKATKESESSIYKKLEKLDQGNKNKSKTELIDHFIESEPSISRRSAHFFDPISLAKQSITDQENIVSETLAQIYYDQGYKEKSIKIYDKLSLKFPEKSSYFASQILKIEKEL